MTEQTSDARLEALGRIVGFAIHAGEGLDERDYPIGEIPTDWKRAAEAILEDLGFDPEHPPVKGAVKVAVDALIREQCHCREYKLLEKPGCQECSVEETCGVLVALRALTGEEQR